MAEPKIRAVNGHQNSVQNNNNTKKNNGMMSLNGIHQNGTTPPPSPQEVRNGIKTPENNTNLNGNGTTNNGNKKASSPAPSPSTPITSTTATTLAPAPTLSAAKLDSKQDSKLWQLIALAKEVSKDAEAVQVFDRSVEEQKAAAQELDAKRAEAKTLREFNDKLVREFSEYKTQASRKTETLFAEFEQKYKTYESNKDAVTQMESQVATLQEELKVAEEKAKGTETEVERLNKGAKEADEQNKTQAAKIKDMTAECERHRSCMQSGIVELEACKGKLYEARKDLGDEILHDYGPEGLRKLGLDLKALSKKCHSLVMEYFNDPEGAKDSASEIQDLKSRFPNIPLTTSTTKPAAHMRCAVAEAVISQVLQTQIFIPFYLPNGSKAAASSLLDLFGDDERRRAIYRCQILAAMSGGRSSANNGGSTSGVDGGAAVSAAQENEATRVEDDIISKAAKEVRTTLHPLVMPGKTASFYHAVPVFFREALSLWSQVQRSRELITAEAPDVNEVQPPSKYDDFDQTVGGNSRAARRESAAAAAAAAASSQHGKPFIAAVFFPQVATREDLIFNGMALWSNQPMLLAAAQEVPVHSQGGHPNGSGGSGIGGGAAAGEIMIMGGSGNGRQGHHARRKSVVATEMPPRGRSLINGS